MNGPFARFLPLILATSFLLMSGHVFGQATGSIIGTIKDQSGAILPGVSVRARNVATGFTRETVTDADGNYVIALLPVGTYEVTAELAGFKKAVTPNVILEVDARTRVDLILQVGEITEVVEVTEAPPLVQAETSEVGSVIEERRVTELPLNARNFLQLALLAPGAVAAAQETGASRFTVSGGGLTVNINGGRDDQNYYLIDGVSNTDVSFNNMNIPLSVDAVQEFKVKGTLYSAEYGNLSGGQVSVSTKSGSNKFHGTLFEFLRNDALDARNFFDPGEAPPFKQNQFGFSFGGPIIRDRTFFFGNYEGLRVRQSVTQTSTLPTEKMLRGDFSGLPQIFDPMTTRRDPNDPNKFIRDPFPNNIIPPQRIHPASAFLASLLPKVQQAGAGNFTSIGTRRNDRDQFTIRIDHRLSDRDNLLVRFTFAEAETTEPFAPNFLSAAPPAPPGFGINFDSFGRNLAISETHVFGTNLVNEFRFGFNRANTLRLTENSDIDFYGMFKIPGTSREPFDFGLPPISVAGFSDFGDTDIASPFNFLMNHFQWTDNLVWTRGNHSLKFGADIWRQQFYHTFDLFIRGWQQFSGGFTADPRNPGNTGNSFADFLLGIPTLNIGSVGGNTRGHSFIWAANFYVHDDWKATPRLTLNLGLRYEFWRPPLTREPRSAVDFKTGNLVINREQLPAGLERFREQGINFVTFKEAGWPRTLVDSDKNNFGPRFGFAYDLTGGGRTVLRGGFGWFFATRTLAGTHAQTQANIPFFGTSAAVNLGVGGLVGLSALPTLTWDNSFTAVFVPNAGNTTERNFPLGDVYQWSLNVQHQLTNALALEIDYIGSLGRKTDRILRGNQRIAGKGNPNPPRPFPQLGDFILFGGGTNSHYEALMLKAEQRFVRGLAFVVSYTFSRSIDTASNGFESGGVNAPPQNSYNPNDGERGLSNFHSKHRFVLSYVYELPFGRGRRFLTNIPTVLDHIIGGWQVSGVTTFQSGQPLTPVFQVDPSGTGFTFTRPNQVCDPNRGAPHTVERWFRTECFERQPPFFFGNAGRNTVIGPGFKNWDFALLKNFRVREPHALQLRAEFFNLFNNVNFQLPNRVFDSPNFGRIFGANPSRQIQFGLKYVF